MKASDEISKIAQHVAELCQTIRAEAGGSILPLVTSPNEVNNRLTGLLYAVQKIGATLDILGGQLLVHKVIAAVEEHLDDVQVAVFLNRRWDGHPRSGPRLTVETGAVRDSIAASQATASESDRLMAQIRERKGIT